MAPTEVKAEVREVRPAAQPKRVMLEPKDEDEPKGLLPGMEPPATAPAPAPVHVAQPAPAPKMPSGGDDELMGFGDINIVNGADGAPTAAAKRNVGSAPPAGETAPTKPTGPASLLPPLK
jgi:hypothetical protein